jgi:hypothetical protein
MPTIQQLIRKERHPIENRKNLLLFEDVLSIEEYVLGCMCDSFRSEAERDWEILTTK